MPPVGGEPGVKGTELQKEVFGGVPGSVAPPAAAAQPPPMGGKLDEKMDVDGGEVPKGVKRAREEEEEEEGSDEGAPMEQDSDDDAPMEEDSDDDDDDE